jgi:hypothetical protein
MRNVFCVSSCLGDLVTIFFQVCNVIFIIQHQERHRGGFDENVDEKQSKEGREIILEMWENVIQ